MMGACKTVTLLTAVTAVVLAVYVYSSLPPDVTEPGKLVMFKAVFFTFSLIGSTYEKLGFGDRADLFRSIGVKPSFLVSDSNLEVRDSSFSGVQVRIYKPQVQKGGSKMTGLMFFHGGGWALSSTYAYDRLVGRIALGTGAVVVSVEYRLAPEQKFPVPFEDCLTATQHFLQHAAEFGVDPTRIGVAGDSSGGNLAAAVALRLEKDDKKKLPPLKLQALVYPALQAFDFQTPSYARGHSVYVNLPAKLMIGFWVKYLNNNMSLIDVFSNNGHTTALRKSRFASYVDRHFLDESVPRLTPEDISVDLPDDLKDILNPYFSPLMAEDADLSGLPDTYVSVCGTDVLRDDGIMYAKRLEMAGVQVRLARYPSGFHGVMSMDLALKHFEFELGRQMLQDLVTFVREKL
ncbi:PREDICTED: arylacetamide deacetylase-like [Branchiostoma belcheri]|uniref:Arylacetamide deacetylase-like n=1 Tax=Branchiostoma belcheri TaxID=7741 RepID=A0A6P5AX16_BRABE|nr:PREDICTED: arylacetamide deacetylase-like [Branchiostoma belcheri]